MVLISNLGTGERDRDRQEESWTSLASHPSLLGEPLGPVREFKKKKKRRTDPEE